MDKLFYVVGSCLVALACKSSSNTNQVKVSTSAADLGGPISCGINAERSGDKAWRLPSFDPETGNPICGGQAEYDEAQIQLTCDIPTQARELAFNELRTLLLQGEDTCPPGLVFGREDNQQSEEFEPIAALEEEQITALPSGSIGRNNRGLGVSVGLVGGSTFGNNVALSLRFPKRRRVSTAHCQEAANDPHVQRFYFRTLETISNSITELACDVTDIHPASEAQDSDASSEQAQASANKVCSSPEITEYEQQLLEEVRLHCEDTRRLAMEEGKPYCKGETAICAIASSSTQREGRNWDIAPSVFASDTMGFGAAVLFSFDLDAPPRRSESLRCVEPQKTALFSGLKDALLPLYQDVLDRLNCKAEEPTDTVEQEEHLEQLQQDVDALINEHKNGAQKD